jgi:hypothetical protein
MADLSFNVHETIDPAVQADEATITPAATYKALIPAARYQLGVQFFNKVGRKLRIRAFGKITTSLGASTGQFGILFGTGADNDGVNVCQSATFTQTVSKTNLSWDVEAYIHARSLGATGTLFGTGRVSINTTLVAATLQPILIPPSAAVVSGSCDLTGVLLPSLQYLTSGSGLSITVQDFEIVPMS